MSPLSNPVLSPILEVKNLSFAYGQKPALDEVNFTIAHDETVMLLGPNGAGKSTLFSLISGLFISAAGDIFLDNISIRNSAALKVLGIVFQAQTLDLDLSIRQNLIYAASLHGISEKATMLHIQQQLENLDLSDRLDHKIRTLNGGHRRRAEIVRAGLHRPKLLLLDEPTVGLDIPTRSALVKTLHQQKCAVLWATHLIDEIAETDRVIVMHEGRILADGTPASLMKLSDSSNLSEAYQKLTGSTVN